MDDREADIISRKVLSYYPSYYEENQRTPSPKSINSYNLNKKYIKLCKNCNYTFRSEFRPHDDFCTKDCETSYSWFKVRHTQENTVIMPIRRCKSEEDSLAIVNINNNHIDYKNEGFEDTNDQVKSWRTTTTASTSSNSNENIVKESSDNSKIHISVNSEVKDSKPVISNKKVRGLFVSLFRSRAKSE